MELKKYQITNGLSEDIFVDMAHQQRIIANNNNNNTISRTKITFVEEPVVKLTDVSIGFFKNVIFECLNLSVPNGKIYAILGPKKCGKTLILQCIAGLIKPIRGDIKVLSRSPHCSPNIGYMPQDISLFDDMTVEETMKYFGQLYDLPLDLVSNKIDFLCESISTNRKNILVKCLTNNDKVVVSLAITVLHSPKILLLDELTVYCDPLLKKSIWKQLKGLCAIENVTIIMSTNHIEEAKHSDIVGFIRNGSLREEELPKQLAKELSFDSVEDIFIGLFTNQKEKIEKSPELRHYNQRHENNHKIAMNNNNSFNEINLSPNLRKMHKIQTSSVERISVLYYKNLKAQTRNIPLLVFQLLYPAIAISLFCACIGKNPYEIPVGVYNPDKPSFVSDIILRSFNEKIISLKHFDNFDSAIEAVRQHNVWAILSFPHNYTRSMLERSVQACESPEETEPFLEDESIEEPVIRSQNIYNQTINRANNSIHMIRDRHNSSELELEDTSDAEEMDPIDDKESLTEEEKSYDSDDYEAVDEPKRKLFTTIDIYMDNTNLLISGAIKAQVILALKKAKNRSDMNSGATYAPPLQIVDPNVYGSNEVEMSEFITPGIIIAVVFLSSLLFPGLTIIRERKERQFERSTIAGVRAYELIVAHLIIHLIILIVQISAILFSTFVVFDLPLFGSIYLVFALIFVQGLNGLVYSTVISSFCRDEIHAIIVWLTTFSIVVILGGTFWPIECMPRLAIFICKFLPQSIAGNGLRSVLSRGWDLSYPTVQFSLLVPIVWIIIQFVASIMFFRIRK